MDHRNPGIKSNKDCFVIKSSFDSKFWGMLLGLGLGFGALGLSSLLLQDAGVLVVKLVVVNPSRNSNRNPIEP